MDLTHSKKYIPVPARLFRRHGLYFLPISIGLAILVWETIVKVGNFPPWILPSPDAVWLRFLQVMGDGTLLRNTFATLEEVLAGLGLGVLAATLLGYLLAKSPTFERLFGPYIVASQSIPTVAIAPLLVIWFGFGLASKVLICALIVFFPVLVNTVVGVRSVPEELRELMRSLQATRWQTIRWLEVPAALPVFLGGLRIGATLSVIGAVVGEFVGANQGLGFMINRARGQYDTALVFVAVLALILLALALYGIVVWIETRSLKWRQRQEQPILSKN
jgi:putative riboflavin transport system permease protein